MATIINNPPANQAPAPAPAPADGGSGIASMLIGIAFVILVAILFIFYGLPMMRGGDRPVNDGTMDERQSDPGTTINIPDKVEVDINR